MIQTTVWVKARKGANLLIEPKAMISPKGRPKIRVTKNISMFSSEHSNNRLMITLALIGVLFLLFYREQDRTA
jgi:hypothetical protein